MYKYIRNQKGITLIELLIVMIIVALVMTMAFSLQGFGDRIFGKGQSQYTIQSDIRGAAGYITKEVRLAKPITILSSVPASFEANKKYIYVDGNSIKYYMGGSVKNILTGPSGFTPTLVFDIGGSGRVLNFKIHGSYKEQDYEVGSEVIAENMDPSNVLDVISGTTGGGVVCLGPTSDAEAVNIDTSLLDLKNENAFLEIVSGCYEVEPPPQDPGVISTLDFGQNGSKIQWTSNNTLALEVIEISTDNYDAIVKRPAPGASDENATLTATITKGTEISTKAFDLVIRKLNTLGIDNAINLSGNVGTDIDYTFIASGGDESHTFSTTNTNLSTLGLNLEPNGRLHGTLTNNPGTYTVEIKVEDSYSPPNAAVENISITVY